jgi:hypothetical protein
MTTSSQVRRLSDQLPRSPPISLSSFTGGNVNAGLHRNEKMEQGTHRSISPTPSARSGCLQFDMTTLLGYNEVSLDGGDASDLDKDFKYSIIPSYVKEITQDILADYKSSLADLLRSRLQYEAYKHSGVENPAFQISFSKTLTDDPDTMEARSIAGAEVKHVLLNLVLKSKRATIKDLEEKTHHIHLVRRYLDELNQLFKDIAVEEKMEQNINRLVKREAVHLFQKVDYYKSNLGKVTSCCKSEVDCSLTIDTFS